MSTIIYPFVSFLWSISSAIARLFYHVGILTQTQLPVRVVSVGNLQAGGAGKTPLVRQIALEYLGRGKTPCILLRGYGGSLSEVGTIIRPGRDAAKASEVGDEAALLHETVLEAWIGVGKNRSEIFTEVWKQSAGKIDVVLLDDGFQHHAIKRDLDILVFNQARWGRDRVFRDFIWAKKNARLWVYAKGAVAEMSSDPNTTVQTRYTIKPPVGSSFILVTAVANSESVLQTLNDAGVQITEHFRYPDHHPYTRAEVDRLLSKSKVESKTLIMTGKDAVKWRELGVDMNQIQMIEPAIEFTSGKTNWDRQLWGG